MTPEKLEIHRITVEGREANHQIFCTIAVADYRELLAEIPPASGPRRVRHKSMGLLGTTVPSFTVVVWDTTPTVADHARAQDLEPIPTPEPRPQTPELEKLEKVREKYDLLMDYARWRGNGTDEDDRRTLAYLNINPTTLTAERAALAAWELRQKEAK